jgi:hypothetical protein
MHGVASYDISKKGQNCTVGWQSYGNCVLGYTWIDFLLEGETINAGHYIQMHKNL